MVIFYHGSPELVKILIKNKPRGCDPFNKQKGVYLTKSKTEAKLYSIARDKDRKNKNWLIYKNYLFLVEENWNNKKWKNTEKHRRYKLNKIGYVYYIKKKYKIEKNPYNKREYLVKKDITPDFIEFVNCKELKNNIIYISKENFKNLSDEEIYQFYAK